jgi:HK97 family phage prohead protease
MTDRERRTLPLGLLALRVQKEDEGPSKLVGTAAVFGKRSGDLGSFVEVLEPGAFTEALKSSDIRALYNHNPDHLLGRMKAGTLRVWESDEGLEYEVDLPASPMARAVLESVERGDITGNSFSFIVDKDEWHTDEDGTTVRTVRSVKEVYDVGPVTFPAYEDTVVSSRSAQRAKSQAEELEAAAEAQATFRDQVIVRVAQTRP